MRLTLNTRQRASEQERKAVGLERALQLATDGKFDEAARERVRTLEAEVERLAAELAECRARLGDDGGDSIPALKLAQARGIAAGISSPRGQ